MDLSCGHVDTSSKYSRSTRQVHVVLLRRIAALVMAFPRMPRMATVLVLTAIPGICHGWGSTQNEAAEVPVVGGGGSNKLILQLQGEVRALTSLVLAQSERLSALESRVAAGPLPATSKPSSTKPPPPPKKKPPPPPPPKKTKPPKKTSSSLSRADAMLTPAPSLPERAAIISPHLRLVAAVQLDAPLAAAALAPAAAGTAPRFVVAADAAGQLQVLDGMGRAMMPPAPLTTPTSAARILSIVFLGASTPAGKGSSVATPMLFAVAISHGDESADRAGFAFCLYRLGAAKQPTPQQRVVVELVKEANVTWPTSASAREAVGDAGGGAGGKADGAIVETMQDSGDASGPPPTLVALETMSSAPPTSGRGGKAANAPALLAIRSDGMLVTISAVGGVIAGVTSGVSGVLAVRRSANVLALLSADRLVLIELARRAAPRECPVPESVIAAGGELTSVAFDAHVTQLMYVGTSTGETLIFNGRARPSRVASDETGAPAATAGVTECRWLDSVAVEAGVESEPAHALGTVRGYLIAVGERELSARNMSTMYHASDPQPTALVHAEPLPPPERTSGALRAPFDAAAPRRRVLLTSGNALLVESGGVPAGSSLRLYACHLPYEPPVPPSWPAYVMGAAVIGITACWQLYKRRGKGDKDKERDNIRGGRGSRGASARFDAYDEDRPGGARGGTRGGAGAHYAAHMRSYGGPGGGSGSSNAGGRARGQYAPHVDDFSDNDSD